MRKIDSYIPPFSKRSGAEIISGRMSLDRTFDVPKTRASLRPMTVIAALLACFAVPAQANPNSEAGIYMMTRLAVSAIGSFTPVSQSQKPGTNILDQVTSQRTGFHARYQMASGESREIGSARNTQTSLSDIPDTFIAALLATEDRRFYEHPGIDPLGTVRAFSEHLSGRTRGASGITQQLIKNQIVGSDVTFSRKAIEAILAIQIESTLTKDDILEAYLGAVWFGRGWGASGAARLWFGKDWDDLNLSEVAFLAGILQGPALFDPERHPERAHARRDHVLARMLATHVITQPEYAQAQTERLSTIPLQSTLGRQEWSDVAIERWIEYNSAAAALLEPNVRSERLPVIQTSLDQRWQSLAQVALTAQIENLGHAEGISTISADDLEAVQSYAGREERLPNKLWTRVLRNMSADDRVLPAVLLGGDRVAKSRGWGVSNSWFVEKMNIPPGLSPGDVVLIDRENTAIIPSRGLEGAVVVMNIHTGEVLASIGGSDVRISKFDRAAALRQPGSAVKAFVYLAALEAGWQAEDLVDDSRTVFEGGYNPQNFGRQQFGVLPFYTAFEISSNIAAVKIANQIGIRSVSDVAMRAGAYERAMDPYLPSALGASVTTLRNLVTGYASIGNGGWPIRPSLVSQITDRDGQIWTIDMPASRRGFNDRAITEIQAMMRGVITRGTASDAFRNHPVSVIGKTGTSQGHRDAVFVGMGADIGVGVWLGRDDNGSTNGFLGGSHAAPVAARIFREAYEADLITKYGHDAQRSSQRQWPPFAIGERRGHQGGG